MRTGALLALVVGALLITPAIVAGGEARSHDGLFFRISGGPGLAETGLDILVTATGSPDPLDQGRLEYGGWSADYNLALGAVVYPNLAVHGNVFGWNIPSPTIRYEDPTVIPDEDAEDPTSMIAFGVGATYYFMPVNFYISPTVGLGTGNKPDTETGLAVDLAVGREWWVGDAVGLGLAVSGGYHRLGLKFGQDNLTGLTFALRLSATLN
jgi:hypothetical protein